ncbi:MAG: fatty acid desaturase family protein [Bacteroidota bacterium]|jgi:linoleoyl-CoA desaturase
MIINPKTQVKFKQEGKTAFFNTLKGRIDQHFNTLGKSRHANFTMVVKTLVMLSAYIIPFFCIVFLQPSWPISLLLWTIMGTGLAGIGMCIMHDANHGSYSSNKNINTLLGHTLNMVGGSVCNWKIQHNILHHTYTNIAHMDEDIADKGVLRFNPHTPHRVILKFQYLYACAFYGIMTLYWAVAKDFIQYARFSKYGLNKGTKPYDKRVFIKILLDKVVYFSLFIGLPLWMGVPVWSLVAGFLLMHFTAGIILTLVFQIAHTIEGTKHPLPDANGHIENAWAIHQMETTTNFATGNRFLTFYLGGLNYQVEHHLFPNICHVHYPAIAPIVKKTAEEFGIPYLEKKTFMDGIRSHFNLLKSLGRLPKASEAIG